MCGMLSVTVPLLKKAMNQKVGLLGQTVGGKALAKLAPKAPSAPVAGVPTKAPSPTVLESLASTKAGGSQPVFKKPKGAGGGVYSGVRGPRRPFKGRPGLSLQPSTTLGSGNTSSNGGVNIL